MPVYAHKHPNARMQKGAEALILWGLDAFSSSYRSTIGVCAERSDIQGLTAGDLVGDGKTGNGTGFFIQMQAAAVGHVRAVRRAIMELRP